MDAPSLGQALASLRQAMRGRGGSTTDPARRRAAATLGELLRSDDDELEQFAARHLPGRTIDPATIKALQDLVLGVARLVTLHGGDGDPDEDRERGANALAASVRGTLLSGLEALERAPRGTGARAGAPAEPGATTRVGPAPPPPVAPAPLPADRPQVAYAVPSYALAGERAGVAPAVVGFAPPPDPPPPVASLAAVELAEDEETTMQEPPSRAGLPPVCPSPPTSTVVDADDGMNGTVCDDAPVIAPATPFQAAPQVLSFAGLEPAPQPRKPGAHLGSTAPLSRVPVGPALPFAAAPSPAAVPPPAAAPTPAPAAVPPAAHAPPALPMPVERYAAFLAELSRNYADAPALRARYGFADEAAQRTVGAAFASAFERDPALRATFDELLRRKRGGG